MLKVAGEEERERLRERRRQHNVSAVRNARKRRGRTEKINKLEEYKIERHR